MWLNSIIFLSSSRIQWISTEEKKKLCEQKGGKKRKEGSTVERKETRRRNYRRGREGMEEGGKEI